MTSYRYRWEIKTADSPYSGTDGSVTLSLHGKNGVTEDLRLDSQKFARSKLTSGTVEADEDLGAIITGNLYAELDPGRPWTLDYVKITNLASGEAWVATDVGACTERGCPLLRFEPVEPGDTADADKADSGNGSMPDGGQPASGPPAADDQPRNGSDPPREPRPTKPKSEAATATSEDSKPMEESPSEPERPGKRPASAQPEVPEPQIMDVSALVRQLKEAMEYLTLLDDPEQSIIGKDIVKVLMPLVRKLYQSTKKSPFAILKADPGSPRPEDQGTGTQEPSAAKQFLTLELFAMRNGTKTQLGSVLSQGASGRLALAPGSRILITDRPNEGYGLAGRPGAWAFGPPAKFGIEGGDVGIVTLDGFDVKPLGAELLSRLFTDWRTVVYDRAKVGEQGEQK